MSKITKTLICILLAISCIFTAVACNGDDNPSVNGSNSGSKPQNPAIVGETDAYLVEKGRSDYAIVIPEKATPREITAKDELTLFFEEATGIKLPFTYDNQVNYSETSKYIFIGKTSVAAEQNLIPTYSQVKENGFIVKTAGVSIFLVGYTDFGTLFAVYEFLNHEFDYDYYTEGRYELSKISGDVKTMKYDQVKLPDINTMEANYGYMINDEQTANRHQTMFRKNIYVYVNGHGAVHSTVNILQPATYQAEHPDWYYAVTGQDGQNQPDNPSYQYDWCFTAHGNEKEFDSMTTAVVNELIDEFKAGSTGTMVVIGQRDINKTCTCNACLDVTNKYGAASAKGVIFCNAVLEKIYAWFDGEGAEYKREFYVMLLAYEKFIEAPVTMVDGEYKANSGLEVHDHFGTMLAPINFDFTVPKAQNEESYVTFYRWRAISNVFSVYAYDTNFQCFFTPFNSFESKADLYGTLKENNCISIFDAGQGQDGADMIPSVYSTLKVYLECKLRWDTEIDVNYYTKKYFYGVYKDAGETMYNTFLSFRSHWNDLKTRKDAGDNSVPILSDFMSNMENSALWPHAVVEGWYNNMQKAQEEIAYLEQIDKEEYDSICLILSAERLSPGYLLVQLYKDLYSSEELLKIKLTFKEDVTLTNYQVTGPASKKVASLLTSWGV